MKTIILVILAIMVSISHTASAFEIDYEEQERLMQNYMKDEPKRISCYRSALWVSKTFIMKETDLSDKSVCLALKQEYNIDRVQCNSTIELAGIFKKQFGPMTEQESYDIIYNACLQQ